ncbi:MAG: GC-type dockerin domain-anchored protein [Phycisphaerales bacterium]
MRSRFVSSLGLTACVGACVGLASCQNSRLAHEDEALEGRDAMRFRFEQRAGPSGVIPHNAIMSAKHHRDAMLASKPFNPLDGPAFTNIGPGNIGGRVRAMLIHPTDANTIYIGAATGGVWKTTTGGTTWQPLQEFVPTLTIGSMAMDPNNPNTIYVGTGEGVFDTVEGTSNTAAVRGAGIFKTTDAGLTFTQLTSTTSPDWYWVNRIAFQPGSSTVMLAATGSGIWRTTDAGVNWTRVHVGNVLDVEFNPSNGLLAVAGRKDATPQYSTDGGLTWTAATGIAAGSVRVELEYARSSPSTVFAGVSTGGRWRAYRSTNGGQSYTLQTSGTGVSTLGAYTGVVWVDPTNPNLIIIGGQPLARSTDAGVNLTTAYGVNPAMHADHHLILSHPQYNGTTNRIIYFSTDGGVFRANDSTTNTYVSLNTNLSITQFYGGAINDASGVVVAGAQDNFTLRYNGNFNGWTSLIGGDGTRGLSDPTDPNFFYGASQRLAIARSSNGGVSATSIYNTAAGPITEAQTTNCNFIPPFILDPNNPNRILAGGRSLWRSNNVKMTGPTWAIIKGSLPRPEPTPLPALSPAAGSAAPSLSPAGPPPDHYVQNDPRNIASIAVARGNSDIIYVGHNNGNLYKTTNGTAATPTWTQIDTNAPGLPDRWLNWIHVDRNNPNRVYVSFMTYSSNNVWKSADGGTTWQNASGSGIGALPAIAISTIVNHPLDSNRLYAGTDIGLFLSTDNGGSWAPVTPGVGMVPIEEINWRNNTTMMVVTHGRGIFLGDATLPPACYANCDGSTAAPILNVNDFTCFLNRFAAGDLYANCDNSTTPPVLNVNDFVCFLNAFGAGCT